MTDNNSHDTHRLHRIGNLRLIAGDELVNLILQHYEKLDSRYKGLYAAPVPTNVCNASDAIVQGESPNCPKTVPAQPIDATQALNLSAGVSNCKVSRGRSLS